VRATPEEWTLRLIEQVAFLVDVVGSSNIQTDRVSTKVPQYILAAYKPPSARTQLRHPALGLRVVRWFHQGNSLTFKIPFLDRLLDCIRA